MLTRTRHLFPAAEYMHIADIVLYYIPLERRPQGKLVGSFMYSYAYASPMHQRKFETNTPAACTQENRFPMLYM